jgi:hypothetical protein
MRRALIVALAGAFTLAGCQSSSIRDADPGAGRAGVLNGNRAMQS